VNITYQELKSIELAAHIWLDEVDRQLPAMLEVAIKSAFQGGTKAGIEAGKAAVPSKRGTKPTYPGRSARKPTLRPVN